VNRRTTPPRVPSLNDETLIAGVLRGEASAQRLLYDRHVDRVFRLAYRMCGKEERARELTQSAFIRVFERLDRFEGRCALGSWIHRVAASVILNGLRRDGRESGRAAPLEAADAVGAMPPAGDPRLRERLHAAIAGLAEQRRIVFMMHDVEGYTHEEIGEILGIAPGTSKSHLHRARLALRTELAVYAEEYA
jgi:RNA polymerase sigma-70 factor, ECF subfamily